MSKTNEVTQIVQVLKFLANIPYQVSNKQFVQKKVRDLIAWLKTKDHYFVEDFVFFQQQSEKAFQESSLTANINESANKVSEIYQVSIVSKVHYVSTADELLIVGQPIHFVGEKSSVERSPVSFRHP